MRICLQILYTNSWVELAKVVVPNVVNYARRHGYTWNIQTVQEPYNGYDKLRSIKKIFELNEADVVVSLDCDLFITNYNIKIEDFLKEDKSFYITYGANTYNAGVFIFKKSNFAYDLIDALLSKEGQEKMYCEQDAICEYIREHGTDDFCILPHPSINSFDYSLYSEWPDVRSEEEGCWHPGNFLLHLPGVGMERRLEILKNTPVIL